ncbi:threonine synthase [Erythrobacter crassostreae]|uniref:Threonine synthase n=1 Tax=Erythrobacter crassostreae TaxID=2828328 RepID=A0A9X1F580_9SPHN|nr:threonine synthase [Erythrobacter crassostrea]MBV7259548.1 threonine synthase [Erythrobacter crassostrea]
MEYISTRGSAPTLDFEGATLAGLASDGGLYLPRKWPRFSAAEIRDLRGCEYWEVAVAVMKPFVGKSLTEAELIEICQQVYGKEFSHAAVTPLVQLDGQHWLLELFHGPTLAFKDVALQMLGRLFDTFLKRRDERLTIVGATSGDTGSAAIRGVAGSERVEIFMLHPQGKVSDVQRRQMTTVRAPNVHNLAIDGSFDDAQAHVKRMFGDADVTGTLNLGAVNSINWARLMAQVVYYFYSALQLGGPDRKIAYSVPTGNFGDVFAGYVASRMGLPIETLVVATNINDILRRAINEGDYSAGGVTPTITPSMDIQVSSNFERLLFDAGGRDGAAIAQQMHGFEKAKTMALTNAQRVGMKDLFRSFRADQDQTARAMQWAHAASGQIIDPHTAVGLSAAQDMVADDSIDPTVPIVTLATAHPAKFPDAVERAVGVRPALPQRVGDLFGREEHFTELSGDYEAARDFVLQNASAD